MIVKLEENIDGSVDEVWTALTDPKEMRKWYFDNIPDFKAEPGFKTKFKMDSGERIFTASWLVTEVLPKKKIKYTWSYDEYKGEGPVTFILSPKGEKTLLTVINEGLESFPQDIPEFTRESCMGGWEYFIKKRLPEYFKDKKA